MILLRNTTSALGMPPTTLAQDVTPSTQLTFPSSSQAESIQSSATMETFDTRSMSCSAALPPNVAPPEVRTIPNLQPKRRPEGSLLPEHVKKCDLQWFQQLASAHNSKIASPEVDPAAQPGTLVLLNDVAGARAAEKPKPSRMPGRTYSRPPPSEMTANQPTTAETIYQSSSPCPIDKQPNEVNDPQPENMPRDSVIHPAGVPENIAPDVTTSSLKQDTNSLAQTEPPATPSDHVGVKTHGGELPSCPAIIPQTIFSRFGGDMKVMLYRQGLTSARGTIDITFTLDDLNYSPIALWAKLRRTKSYLKPDFKRSNCVSFACYHLPSLPSNPLEGDGLTPCFEMLMHSPCLWPTSGDLSLQTKRNGKDFIIPLAPPIFVTPDNCIDISAFIRSGENAFSVVQQSDMSNYLFVFHVHYPTLEQCNYLASCRGRRVSEEGKKIGDLCKLELKESWRPWRRSVSEAKI
ncbi:hypothetical protein CY34DRAFT_801877 [Suillus luteus UH-Slu-Lm8-n1]|uniref:Unplaced genomic scaffold CY34scaffold_45, whole genome shotgun sequence n=1 Tax=Suillus luteus UH-Slu-Lm8-n1 TaxID=930992 RepID=A0A0D0AU80_9AGAM|nr:hypothetical protein CY34DRAFT_801877 [Suillus luteus UH-Slu-Lm8-n1]